MPRAVAEWIGRTDDAKIPPRVRLRIFNRAAGHCQAGCGRELGPKDIWQADHIIAIVNGGENRERNLQVACEWCHPLKSNNDVAEKSVVAQTRSKHVGIRKAATIPGSRNSRYKKHMDGRVTKR